MSTGYLIRVNGYPLGNLTADMCFGSASMKVPFHLILLGNMTHGYASDNSKSPDEIESQKSVPTE
jgi:hypothetical protein